MAKQCDGLILYSDAAAHGWSNQGLPVHKVHVARNAIDQEPISKAREGWQQDPVRLQHFLEKRGLNEKPIILFCSRLTPGKGIDLLIEAFALVAERVPDATLVVIGDGPMRPDIVRMVGEKRLVDRVHIIGSMYEESDLAPWFLSATLFAFPRRVGLSIFHAFGYGLPIVTSDDAQFRNPEYMALRPGANGLTYPGSDVKAFARRMEEIMTNERLRARLSLEAQRTVGHDAFSLEGMVSGLLEAIGSTADGRWA